MEKKQKELELKNKIRLLKQAIDKKEKEILLLSMELHDLMKKGQNAVRLGTHAIFNKKNKQKGP